MRKEKEGKSGGRRSEEERGGLGQAKGKKRSGGKTRRNEV